MRPRHWTNGPRFQVAQARRWLRWRAYHALAGLIERLDTAADRMAVSLLWNDEPAVERRVVPPVKVIPHCQGIFVCTLDPARALDEFLHADLALPREVES